MQLVCESYLPDPQSLAEDMSFKQLRNLSEPKRIYRAATQVRTPPLDIDAYKDAVYYYFNYKSSPSTEHKRHKGYVKFIRPRYENTNVGGKRVRKQLQDLPCIVDCDCADFKFRWAWVNKQKRASRVGPDSFNQALNRAPFKTNPGMAPGLCKHLLATSSFIFGQMTSFGDKEQLDLPGKMEKFLRQSRKYQISGDIRNPTVKEKPTNQPAQTAPTNTPVEAPNTNVQNSSNRQNNEPEEAQEESLTRRVDRKEETKHMDAILKKLNAAKKLVEELETSEPIQPDHDFGGVGDVPSPEQPQDQGDEALDLLREIAAHLEELVDLESGAPGEDAATAEEEEADAAGAYPEGDETSPETTPTGI